MQKIARTLLLISLTTASASLAAAPTGYSINSDSPTGNGDSLYRIDLATGAETRVATVKSLGQTRIDVEGLAFAPDGTLYGMDDDAMTLFALNPDNALVQPGAEFPLTGLPVPLVGGHDFGMTFACDGNLYATALAQLPDSRSLFRVGLTGVATRIGAMGSLNPVTISALAAWGNPVELYGLGNGADGNGDPDTPNLYQIDVNTGIAALVGPLGAAAGPYLQGGLAFDDAGQLWAATEGALFGWPSQVMKIDKNTGTASAVKNLVETGFESLAITVPRGCQGNGNSDVARFTVQKQYVDGNVQTPVTLNIRCQTGLPLEQSFTVLPNPGPFGPLEVEFTVDSFEDGELDCEVWETEPANYAATYECFSEGTCAATGTACSFSDVSGGQENLCVIRNYPDPVDVVVAAEWLYDSADLATDDSVTVDLFCRNLHDGDGTLLDGTMRWSWLFHNGSPAQTAVVYPHYDGTTECRTETRSSNSAVESASTCAQWTPVLLGAGTVTCTITNTVFFEGIPALSPLGLAVLSLLTLLTGLVAARRF
jgi:hypothetical protein